jgi:polyhydroxybutyrate depolymerase
MTFRRIVLALAGAATVVVVVAIAVYALLFARYRPDELEASDAAISETPGTYRTALEVDGRVRTYLLHLPPAVTAGRGLPIVIVIQGGGSEADRMDSVMGWTPVADREGFAVAFPQGYEKNWNDGRGDSISSAVKEASTMSPSS